MEGHCKKSADAVGFMMPELLKDEPSVSSAFQLLLTSISPYSSIILKIEGSVLYSGAFPSIHFEGISSLRSI